MEQSMSRRTFTKTAGAAAAVAGLTCMARIGKADEPAEVTWDYEADLVVVGGGGAGFCAGIEAAEVGSTVLVIEKAGTCGGNSYMCGGAIMCGGSHYQEDLAGVTGDTGEQFADDMVRRLQGFSNPDMVREMCLASADAVDWMAGLGRVFDIIEVVPPIWQFDDGHEVYPRAVYTNGKETGVHFPPLQDKLESYGDDLVTILTNTEATHLMRDETGRVIGVEAETGDGTVHAKANKGVLISTAGIDHNLEMAKDYNHQQYWGLKMIEAGLSNTVCFDNTYNTGDGVRMGMEVGAELACSSACCMQDQHYIGGVGDYEAPQSMGYEPNQIGSWPFSGNTLVNPRGKRFVQEDAEWGFVVNKAVNEVIDCGCNLDELDKHCHIVCDADHVWMWQLNGVMDTGSVVSADTLEELAELIDVPADALVETVERWNGFCDQESDPDFDRRTDFGKIENGPFYADIVRPGVLGSASGLKTNADTQVLDPNGDPIPGLYAAGMSMGGNWMPPFYPGCGWAILGTIVWGRKAGQTIAAAEPVA